MINDILLQASNFWLAVHLSEWCTKSDLVLLGHCKITSHQNGIKISMNSNLKLKFDKIYPFNLESERYGYMFKINCDTCRNVVGCLAYDATQPERIYNPITAIGFSAMFTFQLDNTER